jgi:dolichol-phosphate mannosyltransferase
MNSFSSTLPPELIVVMPVFNEQDSIRKVVLDWFQELSLTLDEFYILVINDGSTDGTKEILRQLQEELGNKIEVICRENRGHGQTCLEGYRYAAEQKAPYILQIDSDGQCDPKFFPCFWQIRHDFDVIYGKRTREDGARRILASSILRLLLRYRFGVDCVDPNVPYRLMQTSSCGESFQNISQDFFLANVALAVTLRRITGLRHGIVPIRFLPRHGGEPSVPLTKFAEKAIELVRQLAVMKTPST